VQVAGFGWLSVSDLNQQQEAGNREGWFLVSVGRALLWQVFFGGSASSVGSQRWLATSVDSLFVLRDRRQVGYRRQSIRLYCAVRGRYWLPSGFR
jgi:hypothetical protein